MPNRSGVQIRRILVAAAVVGAIVFSVQASSAADLYDTTSTPLGAAELTRIYSGQTWHWESGAGYFGPEKEFQAWSVNEAGQAGYGIGQWTAGDAGRLCFEATWQFDGESTQVSECFGHRRVDGVIHQRVEPAGEWYVFASVPPRPGDEINKLTPGNDVAARIEQIRTR